jgi:outer membrane protein OmpA-like peptidoglycan-associated protein
MGKQVDLKDWSFINFCDFSHPAMMESENFRLNKPEKRNGVVRVLVVHGANGITTRLINRLDSGKIYDIGIQLKMDKIFSGRDYSDSLLFPDGRPFDSIDYDYNFPISLITYFSANEPKIKEGKRDFVLFDPPKDASPDSPGWFHLHKTYVANGTEEYFSIGTFTPADYIEILRTEKNDTSDFSHKFARYFISNVSIFPIIDSIDNALSTEDGNNETPSKINESFYADSILMGASKQKFIVRKVNFEPSSFELSNSSKHEIDKIAFFMNANAIIKLNVTGHTDSIGTNQYNQALSEKRAKAVLQYLISRGVEKERLTYAGKGESEPLDDQLLKKNSGINRRVEFEFKVE